MSVEVMALVLHHSSATGIDKVVLLGIANHEGDGGAWPTVATLSRYANADTRNVQRAIARCIRAGELRVQVQGGGTPEAPNHLRPNRYRVTVVCPPWCDRTAQHRDTRPPEGVALTPPHPPALTPPGGADATPPPGASATPPVAPAPPKPSVEPSLEPSLSRSRPSRAPTNTERADFDAWWHVYPRKVGKGAALKAYVKALRSGVSVVELADAVCRLAADPNLPEPEFVPHAATWLNREGWKDDPYPPRAPRPGQPVPFRPSPVEAPSVGVPIDLPTYTTDEARALGLIGAE